MDNFRTDLFYEHNPYSNIRLIMRMTYLCFMEPTLRTMALDYEFVPSYFHWTVQFLACKLLASKRLFS